MKHWIPSMTLMLALAAGPVSAKQADDRDLLGMAVIGNRELPMSLYIVPWKRARLGDGSPSPSSSLLSEGLSPLDPEVFRRELNYYEAVQAAR